MRRSDFGGSLAAMARGETAERADDRGELAQPTVVREHAEERGRRGVELQLLGDSRYALRRVDATEQRAGSQRFEIGRFAQRLAHRREARLDGVDRLRFAREIEQRRRIAPT